MWCPDLIPSSCKSWTVRLVLASSINPITSTLHAIVDRSFGVSALPVAGALPTDQQASGTDQQARELNHQHQSMA